jgi:hypothetical protein
MGVELVHVRMVVLPAPWMVQLTVPVILTDPTRDGWTSAWKVTRRPVTTDPDAFPVTVTVVAVPPAKAGAARVNDPAANIVPATATFNSLRTCIIGVLPTAGPSRMLAVQ